MVAILLVASEIFSFGDGLGLALDGQAFLDQGLKHFAAFFLRLGESAQAGQPDLLCGLFDGARQLGTGFFVGAHFLQFLDHDGLQTVMVVKVARTVCRTDWKI
jgi:hypothetical protein